MSSHFTFAQQKMGIYQGFKKLYDISQNKQLQLNSQSASNNLKISLLEQKNEFRINPHFISSLLVQSQVNQISLGSFDECSIYDLFLSQSLMSSGKPIDYLLLDILDKQSKSKVTVRAEKDVVKEIIIKQKCKNSLKLASYFSYKNFLAAKSTLLLDPPKDHNECADIHKFYQKKPATIYLCSIFNKLKTPKFKKFNKLVQTSEKEYFNNVCQNINNEKKFCSYYFNQSYWKKIKNNDNSLLTINETCKEILNIKKKLSLDQINSCIYKMENDPSLCLTQNRMKPSLFPRRDCEDLSTILNYTRLKPPQKDCPGNLGNEAMVNISRIIDHFTYSEKDIKTSMLCSQPYAYTFLNFNKNQFNEEIWGNQICYQDTIKNKEICRPYIAADDTDNNFSLSSAIHQILTRKRGITGKTSCKVIAKKEFKPALLEFQLGCFILIEKENCLSTSCPFTVVYNSNKYNNFTLKDGIKFDYFRTSYQKASYSQHSQLVKGLLKKTKKILNLQHLKDQFKEHPDSLIHGMACAEDILPHHFRKEAVNQCRPLPFIIHGHHSSSGSSSIILTTALDDVSSPRRIRWPAVYNGIRNFVIHHPMKYWSLHAIY